MSGIANPLTLGTALSRRLSEEDESPLEELFRRVPDIGDGILDYLDNKSLYQFEHVNRSWAKKGAYDNQQTFLNRSGFRIQENTNSANGSSKVCILGVESLLQFCAGSIHI